MVLESLASLYRYCTAKYMDHIQTSLLSTQHTQKISAVFLKKLYGPFLWMGFNCLKAIEPLRGDGLLFLTTSQETPDTHLIDVGRMKS